MLAMSHSVSTDFGSEILTPSAVTTETSNWGENVKGELSLASSFVQRQAGSLN